MERDLRKRTDMNQLISETVEQASLPRPEIADACGQLYGTFNRQVNINDAFRFPADQVLPLMRATRDPRILEWLVAETWDLFHCVLVKEHPKKIMFNPEELAGHLELMTEYMQQLARWTQGKVKDEEMIELLDKLRAELIAVRKAVSTRNRQPELEFSGGKK